MACRFPEVKTYPLSISKGIDDCLPCKRSITGLKSASGSLPILVAKKPVAGIMTISTSLASWSSA